MICWKCKESVQSMICIGCSTIQPPPPNPDFFEILSLKRSYFITQVDISTAHRAKIRLVHPDRFVKKSAVERRMSLQWTAFLNEAKRVLCNTNIRARYLATGEVKPKEVGGPRLSGEFLEYIFDVQMELGSGSEEEQSKIIEDVRKKRQQRLDIMNADFLAFEQNQERSLEGVEVILAELQYLENILGMQL
jgi:DnaJ-class molecular chaperone